MPVLNKNIKVGDIFDKLTVIQYCKGNPKGCWKCQCECGNILMTESWHLLKNTGHTCKDCHKKYVGDKVKKHGRSRTVEYQAWVDMKDRCYNPNNEFYKDYGGRGIIVCGRWLESFENFYEDMGDRPNNKYSLERQENNNNYEPKNCYWATKSEQNNNKRNNHYLTYQHRTQTLTEWSREYGLSFNLVRTRICVLGWSIQEALTTSANKREKIKGRFTSKYRGVCWSIVDNKWRATIKRDKKYVYIGKFKEEKEAALAYNKKAIELFSENAYQNEVY